MKVFVTTHKPKLEVEWLASGTAKLNTGGQWLASGTSKLSTGEQWIASGTAKLSTGGRGKRREQL